MAPPPRASRAKSSAKPARRSSSSRKKKTAPIAAAPIAAAQTDAAPTAAETPPPEPSVPFPIVGIGASAGGLEALEQFLSQVPAQCGMAFVVVQHLDPTRKGLLPELLQRATPMKVISVKDRTRVRKDCVYAIPPGKDMSLLRGVLHLFEPTQARGLRLPIDTFLRSLALDQQQHSVGVILSGMGSDGTQGVRAIKEVAGVVLVQDPASAKFDGMPRSAIDAGLADFVAPAGELPGKILSYMEHAARPGLTESVADDQTLSALEKVVILLRGRTGHDFSLYKKGTLSRRVERRMGIHKIGKASLYVRYLQANPQELDLLFKELLIGVTRFFRDPAAWQHLREQILPALLAARPGGTFRAWVAGCSTGEEAYSLAIAFTEAAQDVTPTAHHTLQIFATDLDRDAIDQARAGIFPASIGADVTPERLSRFFVKEEAGYRVRNAIRETIVFAPHNLIMDPPFTKLDILTCRNLLIYLAPEMQKKLIPLFHYSLGPDGVLLLGSAETVGTFTDLFAPLSATARTYRRKESLRLHEPVEFPSSFGHPSRGATVARAARVTAPSLQTVAEQLVLQRYAPASVLVNEKGDILFISGRTGRYLEPAAGKANWNVFAMAREGLTNELSRAFQRALRSKGPVVAQALANGGDGGAAARRPVDITVQRLDEPERLRGLVMIVFAEPDAPPKTPASRRSRKTPPRSTPRTQLEAELDQARADLQATREGVQTSQEELKSTNEEMQSTNEELQSTNEELTTSKEEMQSMNEELQTVNHELQGKVDELSRSNNDMKNLLNSTDIATLFLDNDLKVRRFTTQATKIIQLIPGDVGRPITDLASELLYAGLDDDARETLRVLGKVEKSVSTKAGCWFTVRILPYRTLDNRIDGVVITFSDITVAKTLEAKLREKQAALERHVARQSGQMRTTKARPGTAKRKRAPRKGGA